MFEFNAYTKIKIERKNQKLAVLWTQYACHGMCIDTYAHHACVNTQNNKITTLDFCVLKFMMHKILRGIF